MKILIVSNAPWSKTGYGVQTNLFSTRLQKAGHEVAVLCYYGLEGGAFSYNGILCFPRAVHPYGMDVMNAHAKSFGAHMIMTLMDAWVVDTRGMEPFDWIAYYPVDHEPMPQKVRQNVAFANFRIAMSKFGIQQSHNAGLDCYYVPHGVDTELYKPMDKIEAREKLNLPKDAWIVGTVAMNKGLPSRKNFPAMLQAFAEFKRKHTDALYYLHTQEGIGQDGLGGVNIPELCGILGLIYGKDVVVTNPYNMCLGLNDEMMASLYSAMDVHLLASTGEGFGVPIIEAQSCGCPVIVGGWTSMPELVYSGHIIDKSDADRIYTGIASYQYQASAKSILRKLELEFKKPSPRDKAREGMVDNYDINLVFDRHMLPTFQDIEKRKLAENDRYEKVAEARK